MTDQYAVQNKSVRNLYDKIEKALNFINECETYGVFSCCTYVLSSNPSTNKIISSHYQSILRTAGSTTNISGFNTWSRDSEVDIIRKYLSKFMHPKFKYENRIVEPSLPISGRQLVLNTALPHKAVPGLPVIEYAAFGRNVVKHGNLGSNRIAKIGKIYHMGKRENENNVYLDIQSLASHTFVAGTNGSGKTNTVFKLLEEIYKNKVKFLVIEPAKGEYKNAFFNYPDVNIYGTNPKKTPLLRINPFYFNDEIHVLEHIDKLIEVFNACWPMYAAMPALLKAAVENAYISCGWDIKTSEHRGKYKIYPTIKDVLTELTKELDSSAFSGEVKGNYIGALSTRLDSLTKGLFGQILSREDIGDEILFEQNTIIDLSRAFSTETKSMIMGLIILRLQEHRMRTSVMNSPLKHITVLEEAHHLLRRTSPVQAQEGANLLGKSVEMIANSIAEMRTYGEGFIIVDQSPGLLDMSVIRNTNTKILLRLPDLGDRELVGRAMGLKDAQIAEIARLKKGVCAIYQNDWLEAVLCQIDKAESDDGVIYQYNILDERNQMKGNEELLRARGIGMKILHAHMTREKIPTKEECSLAMESLTRSSNSYDHSLHEILYHFIEHGYVPEWDDLQKRVGLTYDLFNGCEILNLSEPVNADDWTRSALKHLRLLVLTDAATEISILNSLLLYKAKEKNTKKLYMDWYRKYAMGVVIQRKPGFTGSIESE